MGLANDQIKLGGIPKAYLGPDFFIFVLVFASRDLEVGSNESGDSQKNSFRSMKFGI